MATPTIADVLDDAALVLKNAQEDPTIKGGMERFGYTTARLQQGEALYQHARGLASAKQDAYGDQYNATDALEIDTAQAYDRYMEHVTVARLAFKDDRGVKNALGLAGDRKQSMSGWLDQAQQFYLNALNDAAIRARLAQYGVEQADLEQALAAVQGVISANATQERSRGRAQQSTEERDAALRDLQAFIGEYKTLARRAFADDRQQLEKLGIVAPSE